MKFTERMRKEHSYSIEANLCVPASVLKEALDRLDMLQTKNERMRIRIEMLEAQLSKYLGEPETITTDMAE